MDQSGPRHTPLKSPLIERSDLQSTGHQTLHGILTLVFWAFWFYLWLPVLALLAWMLGVQQAFKYMIVLEGYHEVIRLLGIYSLIVLLLGGGLVLWAVYNIIRFRGIENRITALPVTPAEIEQYFGHHQTSVARWQNEQRLYVTHDQKGCIAHVEMMTDGTGVPI